jgi:hypothetical protein
MALRLVKTASGAPAPDAVLDRGSHPCYASADTVAMQLKGGCLCGAVRYEISAVFDAIYCHCSMCRKNGGGPVTASAHILAEHFKLLSGQPQRYRSSAVGSRCFCSTCGTMLYFEEASGRYYSVNISTLDDPAQVAPAVHQCIESRLPWFEIADDLPRYEGNTLPHPDRRPRRA